MNYVDFAVVEYDKGTAGFAVAPLGRLCLKQRVETEFGIGTVANATIVCEDDVLFKILKTITRVDPVQYVLQPVEWGEENGLSDQ